MFSQLSVRPRGRVYLVPCPFQGGQYLCCQVPCGDGYVQGGGYSPLPPQIHGTYGRQVGGTHPIGMLSCLRIELLPVHHKVCNENGL